MKKTILGLDLGTNSIGWALIKQNFESKYGEIFGLGSRIIPMSQDILGEFGKGNSVSQTSERTDYRGARRLRERYLLRRERLHRILNILGFLPKHYASQIDFTKRFGKFINNAEPKLAYNGSEFIFKNSFEEMVADFKKSQPQLFYTKPNGEETKIPYDWTIYYLRKKALTQKITKEELAWIILNFNQKRGYYQLRGEDDEKRNNKKEYSIMLRIIKIEEGEVDKKNDGKKWYKISFENGWEYSATFTTEPNWINSEREFLIIEEYDDEGNIKIVKDKRTDKIGKEKRKITPLPSFDEINLMSKKDQDKIYKKIKARTEITISNSGLSVGEYIYDHLLKNPNQKIKGKLIRTIERKYYKDELTAILKKQIELQPELFTEDLLSDCIRELYKNNEAHQQVLSSKDFLHLIINDIIFYQRPLRSQKSSIGNCELEFHIVKNKETGEEKKIYLKTISKSNPYYQEFRVLQWVYNLKIYRKEDDADVTSKFINTAEDKEKLFAFLMSLKEIDNKTLMEYLLLKSLKIEFPDAKEKAIKDELKKRLPLYRWNYVFDSESNESKKYPMNETGYEISRRLNKIENLPANFLTPQIEYQLWHLIYSVTDKTEYEKALNKFAEKNNIDSQAFVESFKNVKPFPSDYGSFSEKAIKKLLPLMRFGKFWDYNAFSEVTKKRIDDLINGVDNDNIKLSVREKAEKHQLKEETDFQGLPLWLAQYVVYNRHSESEVAVKWKSVEELEKYLDNFKQHSLRNPIVEQVVTEALRVVKDIWQHYGNGEENFFDEIHIELGRELKNTAEERNRLTKIVSENENTNLRIKALLIELKNDNVENVRPYSPMQQEILRIYEDGALSSGAEVSDEILKISKKAEPTKAEIQRYKLWLEQKYKSPYTGQIIPLCKLFTSEYQIEHIIPQARYFDDSFSNKVICESAVNKLKDNLLGFEFIKKFYGQKVQIGTKEVTVFTEKEYKEFVTENYSKNKNKRNKLLMEEIPEKMIERQLNDSRYISKYISQVLSNIVRDENNDEGINSKNLIPCNGKITTELKQDWGLNDVWNELILPRFERMNKLTQSNLFTTFNENHQKMLPTVPLEYSKGFQKKRIDHRHHAMDALVIACATRDHINLLNNQSAKSEMKRYDLQHKLRRKEPYFNEKQNRQKEAFKEFYKPWETFTQDARTALQNVVVSFKQNLRVIYKSTNYYEKYVEENGKLTKKKVKQEGVNWAIRKPLHKETVSGKIILDREKVAKGKILTATRKQVNTSFTEKVIRSSVTDTGIQKILLNWLKYKGSSELAFSPEGLEEMNKNIAQFNDGKNHKPIYKVRIYEQGSKFSLGESGSKSAKYVEAAKGTNLFFGVYEGINGKRSFATVPLNEVIERQKQGLLSVPEINEKGEKLLFSLSPNDLVYVPSEDELVETINFANLNKEQKKRIYNVNDFSETCFFTPNYFAKALAPKEVDLKLKNGKLTGSYDFKTASLEGMQIKDVCIKLKVDRLGNTSKF